jgi:hypothetical protein
MNAREAASSSKPWNYIFVQGEEEAILEAAFKSKSKHAMAIAIDKEMMI